MITTRPRIQILRAHNTAPKKPAATEHTPAHTTPLRKRYIIEAGQHTLSLGSRTLVQGIINVTPDSFSRDGCWKTVKTPEPAVRLARKQIREGADMIDIGGESTRPGSRPVAVREELRRVIPVITALAKTTLIPISIDTYKPLVARAALDAGACLLNNIMGSDPQPSLLKMARDYNAAVILMHIRGTPRTMQTNIRYGNVVNEIAETLKFSIEKCLENGIKSDKIIIDPGIGFGKTVEHNLEILDRLNEFAVLDRPVLIGTSRKSFIGKILDRDVGQRQYGTAATLCAAILKGAHIVRVHDVTAARDVARVTDAILNGCCH